LRVEEGFAAGEAEGADAAGVGAFQETQGSADVETVRPFDRDAAMRAGQVALIGTGEGEVVGPEGSGAALHRADAGPVRGRDGVRRVRHGGSEGEGRSEHGFIVPTPGRPGSRSRTPGAEEIEDWRPGGWYTPQCPGGGRKAGRPNALDTPGAPGGLPG